MKFISKNSLISTALAGFSSLSVAAPIYDNLTGVDLSTVNSAFSADLIGVRLEAASTTVIDKVSIPLFSFSGSTTAPPLSLCSGSLSAPDTADCTDFNPTAGTLVSSTSVIEYSGNYSIDAGEIYWVVMEVQPSFSALWSAKPAEAGSLSWFSVSNPSATPLVWAPAPLSPIIKIDAPDVPPARPAVGVACIPISLVDADDQVAICTITADLPAPAGGMTIRLTPPASNSRFSTTCSESVVIGAGSSSANCSITATPNSVAGDGAVDATLTLLDADASSPVPYVVSIRSANVNITDDDKDASTPPIGPSAATAIPTLNQWMLALMSLVLGGFAAVGLRRFGIR